MLVYYLVPGTYCCADCVCSWHGIVRALCATWCSCEFYVCLCACTVPITAVVSAILCFTFVYSVLCTFVLWTRVLHTAVVCTVCSVYCCLLPVLRIHYSVKLCSVNSKLLPVFLPVKSMISLYCPAPHCCFIAVTTTSVPVVWLYVWYNMYVYSWYLVLFRVLTLFSAALHKNRNLTLAPSKVSPKHFLGPDKNATETIEMCGLIYRLIRGTGTH